jgi:hypothetical protein
MIIEHYKKIDNILTQECFFCGSMLIDQVDNDLNIADPDEI